MTRMAQYILNDISISKDIREKIDFIKDSNLSYQGFNEFRFLMQELENFDVNKNLSENRIKSHLNTFIAKLMKGLDKAVAEIEQSNQISFQIENIDSMFFNIISQLAQSKDEPMSKSQKENLVKNIEYLLSHNIDKDKEEILQETLEILRSHQPSNEINQKKVHKAH